MIPIILLGEKDDSAVGDALYLPVSYTHLDVYKRQEQPVDSLI